MPTSSNCLTSAFALPSLSEGAFRSLCRERRGGAMLHCSRAAPRDPGSLVCVEPPQQGSWSRLGRCVSGAACRVRRCGHRLFSWGAPCAQQCLVAGGQGAGRRTPMVPPVPGHLNTLPRGSCFQTCMLKVLVVSCPGKTNGITARWRKNYLEAWGSLGREGEEQPGGSWKPL